MAAKELNIKVAHLESGLRSFDNTMPEETNRIAVDKISNYFFVTEQSGLDNLKNENIPDERIFFVGNTMIDTLVAFDSNIKSNGILQEIHVKPQSYALVTMHRPANVDFKESLFKILMLLQQASKKLKVIIPIHPRTKQKINEFGFSSLINTNQKIISLEPTDYFAFQHLILNARVVITDSGGIQEETTFRKVPCITVRNNTERPSTIELGSNVLVELNEQIILSKVDEILKNQHRNSSIPPLWDGKSTQRIVAILNDVL